MVATGTAQLLGRLGITRSLSRPRVCNDNPFSESHFKTLKYCPEFPGRFGSIEDARSFCQRFFSWYNQEHRHSGIAMMTPADVHFGRAERTVEARNDVLARAWEKNPERFPNGKPAVRPLDREVWINKPEQSTTQMDAH